LARREDFRKATNYSGQKIKGPAVVSYKIDGVRILYREGKFVTRNNKVPPGLQTALTEEAKEKVRRLRDCEIYRGDFFSSNSPLQQHNPEPGCIGEADIYSLAELDKRLYLYEVNEIIKDSPQIKEHLAMAVANGYEGLVIRTGTHWYRVKPEATADVYITGWFEQLDKHKNPKGQLGGFTTNWGKVTAFTEDKRKEFWDNPDQYIGKMVTVRYKERYHTGKFRYAVTFLNFREDKDEESFDTEPPEK